MHVTDFIQPDYTSKLACQLRMKCSVRAGLFIIRGNGALLGVKQPGLGADHPNLSSPGCITSTSTSLLCLLGT